MPTFNEKSKIFVDILKKDSDGGKKNVEICQYITLCALDIICGNSQAESYLIVHVLLILSCVF